MFPSLSPDYVLSVYVSCKMNQDKTIDVLLKSSTNDSKSQEPLSKEKKEEKKPTNTNKQFEFDIKVR